MSNGRPRNRGIFTGVVLITFGILFLLHNYRGFELHHLFYRWWPLLIIFLGIIKLYERSASRNVEPGAARITGGEIFLVLALLALVGVMVAVENIRSRFP